jgi:hypothetical protein
VHCLSGGDVLAGGCEELRAVRGGAHVHRRGEDGVSSDYVLGSGMGKLYGLSGRDFLRGDGDVSAGSVCSRFLGSSGVVVLSCVPLRDILG